MGIFDRLVTRLEQRLELLVQEGQARRLGFPRLSPWPAARTLVLQQDTALELGNPVQGSLVCPMWTRGRKEEAPPADIFLIGPDVAALAGRSAGLGVVLVAYGEHEDPYERFLDLFDALHQPTLEGVTLRSLPSSHQLWCRVSRDALDRGFSLGHLGGALAEAVRALPSVEQVSVVLITDWLSGAPLREVAEDARRALQAVAKSHEEEEKECDECELSPVCDERRPR